MKIIKEEKFTNNGKHYSTLYKIKKILEKNPKDFFEFIFPENDKNIFNELKNHFPESIVKKSCFFWGAYKTKNILFLKKIDLERKYLIAPVNNSEIKYYKKAGFKEIIKQDKKVSKEPGEYFMILENNGEKVYEI